MTASRLDPAVVRRRTHEAVAPIPGDRDLLHQAAVDLATAQVLERLADSSASAPLAVLLTDRARRHRCRAESLRAAVEAQACGR